MLLLFKKRMVWLLHRTRHWEMGDAHCLAGTCLLTKPELLVLIQNAVIVLYKLAKLLCTVFFGAACLPFLLCFLLCQKADTWLQ